MSVDAVGDYLNWQGTAQRSRRRLGRGGMVLAAAGVAVAVWVAAVTTGGSAATGSAVAAGTLPHVTDFVLSSIRPGQPGVSLSAAAGRPVVLSFFASWCTGCQQELRTMAQVVSSAPKGAVVIGIDVNDSSAAARRLLAADHLTYPVGADSMGSVASSFGLVGLPTTVFLDAGHRAVGQVVGPLTPASAAPWLKQMG